MVFILSIPEPARPSMVFMFEQVADATKDLHAEAHRIATAATEDQLQETITCDALRRVLDHVVLGTRELRKVRFAGEIRAQLEARAWIEIEKARVLNLHALELLYGYKPK